MTTSCRRCAPFGACVCCHFLELQEDPGPIDCDQDDGPIYVSTKAAG